MFIFFTSCLCYKLFITCFLRGPLIAFQSKLKKRIDILFLAGRVQTYQKDYCCLSVHAAMFASHQVCCVIFRNKSASFNSQFEQQHLVQHASSTQEYCRSQQLLLFAPSTSTRVQKLIEMFFPEHPFFVGPGTRLPLELWTVLSHNLISYAWIDYLFTKKMYKLIA